jgi:hypothetical protein
MTSNSRPASRWGLSQGGALTPTVSASRRWGLILEAGVRSRANQEIKKSRIKVTNFNQDLTQNTGRIKQNHIQFQFNCFEYKLW